MDRYDVEVVRLQLGSKPEDAAQALATAFGIDLAAASSALELLPTTVRHDVAEQDAAKALATLREAGLEVRLRKRPSSTPRPAYAVPYESQRSELDALAALELDDVERAPGRRFQAHGSVERPDPEVRLPSFSEGLPRALLLPLRGRLGAWTGRTLRVVMLEALLLAIAGVIGVAWMPLGVTVAAVAVLFFVLGLLGHLFAWSRACLRGASRDEGPAEPDAADGLFANLPMGAALFFVTVGIGAMAVVPIDLAARSGPMAQAIAGLVSIPASIVTSTYLLVATSLAAKRRSGYGLVDVAGVARIVRGAPFELALVVVVGWIADVIVLLVTGFVAASVVAFAVGANSLLGSEPLVLEAPMAIPTGQWPLVLSLIAAVSTTCAAGCLVATGLHYAMMGHLFRCRPTLVD